MPCDGGFFAVATIVIATSDGTDVMVLKMTGHHNRHQHALFLFLSHEEVDVVQTQPPSS
jgi:hypothetical protein